MTDDVTTGTTNQSSTSSRDELRSAKLTIAPPRPTQDELDDAVLGELKASEDNKPARTQFHCTDLGNAELFASLFGDGVRYDHTRKHWIVWDEHRWVRESAGEVQRLGQQAAREILRRAADEYDQAERKALSKWALGSESRQRQVSLLALAQSQEVIADDGRNWDTDPYLLGVRNGVIDLRTGEHRDGRREDRITKQAAVEFDPYASSLCWFDFLAEVLVDRDLMDAVQVYAGYSLTGDIAEQKWFLLYGTGANGKSTFVNVLRKVLGDYGQHLAKETLESNPFKTNSNDLAALQGVRFATSLEWQDQRRINSTLLKGLTGGDPIRARFHYQEYFQFQPECKVWVGANHKPVVRDDSEGFWRRLVFVPFTQRIPEERQDIHLEDKLLAEGPGILRWMIEGCLKWQELRKSGSGLPVPEAIRSAAQTYRDEEDPVRLFVADECTVGEQYQVTAKDIWGAFQEWAKDLDQRAGLSRTLFGRRLTELGYVEGRTAQNRLRFGLTLTRLRDTAESQRPQQIL